MYVWGGIAESRWAGTPSYGKTTDLSNIAIHFFLARARKSPKLKNRRSIHYSSSCRGKHLIGNMYCQGHSQVSPSLAAHLAVRPPLHVAPHHDFWPSRVNVSLSRRRTHSGEVRRDSLNKFRPILGGIGFV